MARVTIWCPLLVLGRGLNDRVHWAVRAKRTKQERGAVIWAFHRFQMGGGRIPAGPYEVRIVRVFSGRERLMDDDNWIAACKGCRDQVAQQLHVNDGDRSAVRFSYEQEEGPRSGVRIEIATREAAIVA